MVQHKQTLELTLLRQIIIEDINEDIRAIELNYETSEVHFAGELGIIYRQSLIKE